MEPERSSEDAGSRERDADKTNRALVLTPAGAAAIAVVRLSGPGARGFIESHFTSPLAAGRAIHGRFLGSKAEVIDDPVAVLDEDGRSVDLNLHGGPWVVRAVLELAERGGFEIVATDRLPLPSLAVDASSEIECEVLTHLPMAKTELALRVLLAQTEAWKRIDRDAAAAPEEARRQCLRDRSLHWLLNTPRVAIVGEPNVGKSTLANQLFAQERSITADVPGTTRDWVGEIANIDGLAVMLLDTPGVRETDDPIERIAIERSGAEVKHADLVIIVLDAMRPIEPEQPFPHGRHSNAILVINKTDRGTPSGLPAGAITTVATTGAGIDALRRAILGRFDCLDLEIDRPRCWTDRQRRLLRGGEA